MRELAQHMPFGREAAGAREGVTADEEFADLVRRQSGFVFRVASAVLRNVQDSEDVVQETFLKLYRSGAWKQMNDERAFLARAAWRMALDRVKASRGAQTQTQLVERSASPEQAVIAENWMGTVHRLIDALPGELRQPLLLSAIDEMTSSEIAKVLEAPEGTVRTRIMRARQILKQKMAGILENHHDR